jgi:uncharacterized membrane protein YccF (DUF307 family)
MIFRSLSSAAFFPFGETARNRSEAGFDSDSVEAADVDRHTAPVDFADFADVADELLDSADAADELVFGCRVRTCKGFRFGAATLPVERAATRVAELSRAIPFGGNARNRSEAGFDSDSVEAADVDRRHTAPVDFPDSAGAADELLDSADAADGVGGCRVAPSVVGNNAVRTCKEFRFRAATLPVGRAATRIAELSRAIPFGETAPPDAGFEPGSVDAADGARKAAPVDFLDFAGTADERLDSADADDGLVFGCRVAPSVVGNDAVRTCKAFRFRAATLPVGRAATRVAEFSRATPFGETVRNRADAGFASDSVDAAAAVDLASFAGMADERLDSAEGADGLVLGCRVAPSVVGNDAVRTCRLRAATLRVGPAATRLVPL